MPLSPDFCRGPGEVGAQAAQAGSGSPAGSGQGCGRARVRVPAAADGRGHPGAAASPGASTSSSTNAHPLFRFKALARRHFSQLQPPAKPVLQEAAVKNSFFKRQLKDML